MADRPTKLFNELSQHSSKVRPNPPEKQSTRESLLGVPLNEHIIGFNKDGTLAERLSPLEELRRLREGIESQKIEQKIASDTTTLSGISGKRTSGLNKKSVVVIHALQEGLKRAKEKKDAEINGAMKIDTEMNDREYIEMNDEDAEMNDREYIEMNDEEESVYRAKYEVTSVLIQEAFLILSFLLFMNPQAIFYLKDLTNSNRMTALFSRSTLTLVFESYPLIMPALVALGGHFNKNQSFYQMTTKAKNVVHSVLYSTSPASVLCRELIILCLPGICGYIEADLRELLFIHLTNDFSTLSKLRNWLDHFRLKHDPDAWANRTQLEAMRKIAVDSNGKIILKVTVEIITLCHSFVTVVNHKLSIVQIVRNLMETSERIIFQVGGFDEDLVIGRGNDFTSARDYRDGEQVPCYGRRLLWQLVDVETGKIVQSCPPSLHPNLNPRMHPIHAIHLHSSPEEKLQKVDEQRYRCQLKLGVAQEIMKNLLKVVCGEQPGAHSRSGKILSLIDTIRIGGNSTRLLDKAVGKRLAVASVVYNLRSMYVTLGLDNDEAMKKAQIILKWRRDSAVVFGNQLLAVLTERYKLTVVEEEEEDSSVVLSLSDIADEVGKNAVASAVVESWNYVSSITQELKKQEKQIQKLQKENLQQQSFSQALSLSLVSPFPRTTQTRKRTTQTRSSPTAPTTQHKQEVAQLLQQHKEQVQDEKKGTVEPVAKRATKAASSWTEKENEKLRKAVKEYGLSNWKKISEAFGRTHKAKEVRVHWQITLDPDVVKGPFTVGEDEIIFAFVTKHAVGSFEWPQVAALVRGRVAKQVRERWNNHLNPALKKGPWDPEEDVLIIDRRKTMGWADIAKEMGRSPNAIKYRWNSFSKKRKRNAKKAKPKKKAKKNAKKKKKK